MFSWLHPRDPTGSPSSTGVQGALAARAEEPCCLLHSGGWGGGAGEASKEPSNLMRTFS